MTDTNIGYHYYFLYMSKNWLFWAGISFFVSGIVSFALNFTVQHSFSEDLSGYAIGWSAVGVVFIAIGYIKKENKNNE